MLHLSAFGEKAILVIENKLIILAECFGEEPFEKVFKTSLVNYIFWGNWEEVTCLKKWKQRPSKHSSWWRCLEDVLKTSFVFVFRRRLDQDQYIRLGHRSSRRLQDVFKASSRFLQDVLPRRLQDVFKTSCKNVFKTSSRSLAKMSSRRLAKTSSDIFKTSSRGSKDGSSG